MMIYDMQMEVKLIMKVYDIQISYSNILNDLFELIRKGNLISVMLIGISQNLKFYAFMSYILYDPLGLLMLDFNVQEVEPQFFFGRKQVETYVKTI